MKLMKQGLRQLLLAAVLAWGIPWVLLAAGQTWLRQPPAELPAETEEETLPPRQSEAATRQEQRIVVRQGSDTVEMTLQAYLTGVLLGEMPASFHPEAKKAQAIVARTYTLVTVTQKQKHAPGEICTQPSCCQNYLDPQAFLDGGGDPEAVAQAEAAVASTDGLVLTYNGMLIDATYFSCSGGQTEDAVAVWGEDVPYLRSVDSPGEETASVFYDTVTFTPERFAKALGLQLSGSPDRWFGKVTYTQGGGVGTMQIGSHTFSGTQLRSLLGLRSTAFSVTILGRSIVITTRGYGHRVGMSQYGANAMAQSGSDHRQILLHYYRGVTLTMLDSGCLPVA